LRVIRLLVCLQIVLTQIDCVRAEVGWSTPPPIVSKALNETRGYRVLLPPGYDVEPDRHYPLLLLLDGQRYGDMVAGNVSFLAGAGEIPEHIIIAIDSGDRLRDFTPTDSPHWEGDGRADKFLAFLATELLPVVERDFRSERPHVIWGQSLGGLFAFYTLYAAPGVFDAHLVNDAPLDWDDKAPERALRDHLKNQTLPKQFLYFNSSYLQPVEDPELRYFETLTKQLRTNAPASLRWVYEPMVQESHASIPLLGSIHGMRALYEGYLVPEELMSEGLDAVLKHYQAIKGRVGAPDKVPQWVLNSLGYRMLGQNTPEAVRAFELATQLYPKSANAWDSLSDGYLDARRLQEALKATDKSIEIASKGGGRDLDHYKQKRAHILEQM
jgi:predicted alpha/beta superfamily hydrolase